MEGPQRLRRLRLSPLSLLSSYRPPSTQSPWYQFPPSSVQTFPASTFLVLAALACSSVPGRQTRERPRCCHCRDKGPATGQHRPPSLVRTFLVMPVCASNPATVPRAALPLLPLGREYHEPQQGDEGHHPPLPLPSLVRPERFQKQGDDGCPPWSGPSPLRPFPFHPCQPAFRTWIQSRGWPCRHHRQEGPVTGRRRPPSPTAATGPAATDHLSPFRERTYQFSYLVFLVTGVTNAKDIMFLTV